MPKFLKMPGLIVKNEYIESFKRADNTFKFQIVFDPLKRKLVPINAYENQIDPSSEDLSYAGMYVHII
jgi:exonuclease-1